jgi:hypothetical protein
MLVKAILHMPAYQQYGVNHTLRANIASPRFHDGHSPALSLVANMCTQITHKFLCGHDIAQKAPCALMRIRSSEVHAPVARKIKHDEICETCEVFVRDCGLVVEYRDVART